MIPLQVKPADVDDFFTLAKKLPNLDGIVITVPHKPVAFRHCDTTSERARVLRGLQRDAARARMDAGRRRHDRRRRVRRGAQAQRLRRRRASARCRSAPAVPVRRSRCRCRWKARASRLRSRHGKARRADRAPRPSRPQGHRRPTRPIPPASISMVNATPAGMKPGDPLPVDAARLDGQHVRRRHHHHAGA